MVKLKCFSQYVYPKSHTVIPVYSWFVHIGNEQKMHDGGEERRESDENTERDEKILPYGYWLDLVLKKSLVQL